MTRPVGQNIELKPIGTQQTAGSPSAAPLPASSPLRRVVVGSVTIPPVDFVRLPPLAAAKTNPVKLSDIQRYTSSSGLLWDWSHRRDLSQKYLAEHGVHPYLVSKNMGWNASRSLYALCLLMEKGATAQEINGLLAGQNGALTFRVKDLTEEEIKLLMHFEGPPALKKAVTLVAIDALAHSDVPSNVSQTTRRLIKIAKANYGDNEIMTAALKALKEAVVNHRVYVAKAVSRFLIADTRPVALAKFIGVDASGGPSSRLDELVRRGDPQLQQAAQDLAGALSPNV